VKEGGEVAEWKGSHGGESERPRRETQPNRGRGRLGAWQLRAVRGRCREEKNRMGREDSPTESTEDNRLNQGADRGGVEEAEIIARFRDD
jgi:hypothetical protein